MSKVVSKRTKLGEMPGPVSPAWFTQLLAVRLNNNVQNVGEARSRLSALLREKSTAARPFDWHEELCGFEAKQPVDRQRWEATLGPSDDNYVAGLAASDLASGGDGHHYVVVHTCDEDASQKLHAFFNKHPEMTVGEFINSPQYRMTRGYQERNALRVAAQIAGALNPEQPVHQCIPVGEDRRTALNPGDNLRPELLAKPTYHVVYNTFDTQHLMESVARADEGRGVLYRPHEANVQTQASVLKVLDPSTGFVVRRVDPIHTQVEPIQSLITYDNQQANSVYMKKKDNNRQGLKQYVQQCYLNRQGDTPSSASRPLWNVATRETLRDGDIKLSPLVFVIHGARAASVSRPV